MYAVLMSRCLDGSSSPFEAISRKHNRIGKLATTLNRLLIHTPFPVGPLSRFDNGAYGALQ